MTKITQCRICGNKNLKPFVSFGNQPISSVFPGADCPDPSSSPLDLTICSGDEDDVCHLMQLEDSADLEEMYGTTYGYRSSTSPLMVDHLTDKVDQLAKMVSLSSEDSVLDIGCNDGTLLNYYNKFNVHRYGCDPSSEKFKDNYDVNIDVAYEFFPSQVIEDKLNGKKCKIVTSIAMFYDLDNPQSFVESVASILTDDGVWALEISYLPLFFTNLSYDQTCHEHVTYYGLKQIKWLTDACDLKILNVDFNEMNGGSFYIIVGKNKGPYVPNQRLIDSILLAERPLASEAPYERFSNRIQAHKEEIRNFIDLVKDTGKTILGYGASTKGNITLHYCGLTNQDIQFIGDAQKQKDGLVTPGTRIPIISKKSLLLKKPDYLFVFIWHLRKEVIDQELDYLEQGGKLVFPLPRLHIVTKENAQRYRNTDFSEMGFSL